MNPEHLEGGIEAIAGPGVLIFPSGRPSELSSYYVRICVPLTPQNNDATPNTDTARQSVKSSLAP